MKKYKYLTVFTLSLLFIACKDDKKIENNSLSIDSSKLKQTYALSEDVTLQLKSDSDKEIDSVQYFINDKKIHARRGRSHPVRPHLGLLDRFLAADIKHF